MEILIQNIIVWFEASKYILLFVGAFFEGPAVMVGAGFLYQQGQFNFFQMYACLVLGDFSADVFWYVVGRFGARKIVNRYGGFFNITPEIIDKVEARFKAYQDLILWISKLTMGFGFSLATLLTAGMLKVKFQKYALINIIGGIVWVFILVCVGYFFGNVYELIADQFKWLFVVGLIAFVYFALKIVNSFLVKAKI
ncbi:MAG: DedA family protein [Candidatus Paceibacterota bacterium]